MLFSTKTEAASQQEAQPATQVRQSNGDEEYGKIKRTFRRELNELALDAKMTADVLKVVVPRVATKLKASAQQAASEAVADPQAALDKTGAKLASRYETRYGDRSVAAALAYTGFLYAVFRQPRCAFNSAKPIEKSHRFQAGTFSGLVCPHGICSLKRSSGADFFHKPRSRTSSSSPNLFCLLHSFVNSTSPTCSINLLSLFIQWRVSSA